MTALITGGSRGIGFACVKALLEKEYTVIAAARKESEAIAALKKEYPGRVFFFPCDISKQDQIRALVSFVEAEFGALQMLVNAAGVAPRVRKDILELTPDEMDEVLDINLKGTFFMTQSCVPLLKKGAPARIVNISSMSAYTASVSRGEYCISKAGISMTTKLFASRLAEYGISVLEIRPGIIETDMTAVVHDKYVRMIDEGLTPIRRMGQPQDVAACVAAAADGSLDFCTGTVFDCDGGFSVRTL